MRRALYREPKTKEKNMSNKPFLTRALLVSAGVLMFNTAQAQDYENRSNMYGGVKFYNFDSDWNQDNDYGWMIGGEAPVAERWSLALEHSEFESDLDIAAGDSDFHWTRLGPNFLLKQVNGWQPYLAAGVGRIKQDINAGGGRSEVTWDFGVGVKKSFNDNWFGRGDYKMVRITDTNTWDNTINLAVGYAFGGTPARPVAAAPAAAPAAPQQAPEADTDGDGVVDSRDRCANTPRELAVDANGCPILETQQMSQQLLVNFDVNKSDIKPEFRAEIAQFAQFMTTYANTNVVIEGHTDSDGTDAYNQALSERRATAVMNHLVQEHGIVASRLSAVGFGEARPLADNSSAANKASNRRIMAEVSVEVQEERRR